MVHHDPTTCKFTIENPEGTSWLEYKEDADAVTVLHTVVPKVLSGRGLAGQLADAAWTYTKEQHKAIRSECSYMTAWLKRHGEA